MQHTQIKRVLACPLWRIGIVLGAFFALYSTTTAQTSPLSLAATASASLVNTIQTSQWSSPSPDPAGIVYQPSTGHLLISDSEIEESPQPYWEGANLFEATLPGSLIRTFTTFKSNPTGLAWNNYSNEPSGLALNPANNHLFVSDDDKDKVFEVDPEGDGVLGTADDAVTCVQRRRVRFE